MYRRLTNRSRSRPSTATSTGKSTSLALARVASNARYASASARSSDVSTVSSRSRIGLPDVVRPMMTYGASSVASTQLPSGYTCISTGWSSSANCPARIACELKLSPPASNDSSSSARTVRNTSPYAVASSCIRRCAVSAARNSSSSLATTLSRMERSPDVITIASPPPSPSIDSFDLVEISFPRRTRVSESATTPSFTRMAMQNVTTTTLSTVRRLPRRLAVEPSCSRVRRRAAID